MRRTLTESFKRYSWTVVPKRHASTPICMPALSPTMETGKITEWLVKPGDTVNEGDTLCLVETDKAVAHFETMDEGVVAKILRPEGSSGVKVGDMIALLVDQGDDWENVELDEMASDASSTSSSSTSSTSSSTSVSTTSSSTEIVPPKAAAKTPSVSHSTDIGLQVPTVRLLALQHNIDLSQVTATGPKGITKGDMLNYIRNGATAQHTPPAPTTASTTPVQPKVIKAPSSEPIPTPQNFQDVEITQIRSVIAKRLTESKTTIPHQYTKITCTMDNIIALRSVLKSKNVKVSVNDFIIKAVASALKSNPCISNDPGSCDISVAVATDAGLITPIVTGADSRGLQDISATVRELAGRAKLKKLQPHEFMGGNFTVSNLGMFGIREFSAVINPPQYCILAIGGSKKKFIPDGNGGHNLVNTMTVQMSSDARYVSQIEAIAFLEAFQNNLQDPINMLL